MLTLYIQNISRTIKVADYRYIVMVNAEKIASGFVNGHKRADGWEPLVKMIADDSILKKYQNKSEGEI